MLNQIISSYSEAIFWIYPIVNIFTICVCIYGYIYTMLKREFVILGISGVFAALNTFVHLGYRLLPDRMSSDPEIIVALSFVNIPSEVLSIVLYFIGFVLLAMRIRGFSAKNI